MFEFEQETVDSLLSENDEFKRLYDKYCDLKQKIEKANKRTTDVDKFALEDMKKKRLLLKDKMATIIEEYRKNRAAM